MLALYAAPNPLSIFTTLTPLAQLFSIDNKAAIPPKFAPYPTLVGTAMIGLSTRPPITLAKAPSIPAITITTLAPLIISNLEKSLCIPATPTSVIFSTLFPNIFAVSKASSTTGKSEVPAATIAI